MSYFKFFLTAILLFLVGFFFFGFSETVQAGQFGKGWYENIILENQAACEQGEWQGIIEVFNTQGEPLQADTIEINATLWQDTTGDGERESSTLLYYNSFSNLQEAGACIPTLGSKEDKVILTAIITKNGYRRMLAYQEERDSGTEIDGYKWTRKIYLATDQEPVSIAHSFPTGNYIFKGIENSFYEIDVSLRPGAESISTVVLNIINHETMEQYQETFTPTKEMIDEGTITFPIGDYPDGTYRWRVGLMKDNGNFIYPNLIYDEFTIDRIPPEIRSVNILNYSKTARIEAYASDYGSGLRSIEVYIEDSLMRSCTFGGDFSGSCTVFYHPESSGTYNYRVVAEDRAGWQTEETGSFYVEITPTPRFRITFRAEHFTDRDEYKLQVPTNHVDGDFTGYQGITQYTLSKQGSIKTFLEIPRMLGGPEGLRLIRLSTSGHLSGRFVSCPECPDDIALVRLLTVNQATNHWVDFVYSDQIHINYWSLDRHDEVTINVIEGQFEDYEEIRLSRGWHDTEKRITAWEPVNVVLEAPAKVDEGGSDKIFSSWTGCDETFGPDSRYCRLIEDPLTYRLIRVTYSHPPEPPEPPPLPWLLEVYSYVDGIEVQGAVITNVSGHFVRGTTRFLHQRRGEWWPIDTTIRAPENHGGKEFSRWTGCDSWSYTNRTCHVISRSKDPDNPKKVAANYGEEEVNPATEYFLNVSKEGEGTISSEPEGIDCGSECRANFPSGSIVTLNVELGQGVSFLGFSGAGTGHCTGLTCEILMTADRQVTAVFGTLVNTLNVQSSPLPGISITSSPAGLEGNTSYVIERVEDINGWLTAPQLVTQGGEEYAFISWSGCRQIGSNPRNCGVTLIHGQQSTVTANYELVQYPTARISCEITDCRGPGCSCGSGVWETFPTAVFQVNNASTDPKDSINRSVWRVLNNQGELEAERIYNEKRDWGSFQFPIGNYTINLTVENQAGLSDSTSQQIRVKRDIDVKFECSLDQETWTDDCESLIVFEEQTLYLRDISTPSEGASISSRTWRLNDQVVGSGSIISINISEAGENTIVLRVQDTAGRTGEATKTINVKMGLPEWKEIKPF